MTRARLQPLAANFSARWGAAAELFAELGYTLGGSRSPAEVLDAASDDAIAGLSEARIAAAEAQLQPASARDLRWGPLSHAPIAYFSMEFGLHESLAIYSGGLGVLAGDHLKSASDLGLPLVGVGLFYRRGYFGQSLDTNGWQVEHDRVADPSGHARRALDPAGVPVCVQVETRGGVLHAHVWELAVGRVRLLLLDTDIDANADEDRRLTDRLYGGDERTRIRQELLLGVGGLRALQAVGITPGVLHLNEGHCAFAALEDVAQRVDRGVALEEAIDEVRGRTVFTTHTPVPAGHDRFAPPLVLEHLAPIGQRLGLEPEALLALGRVRKDDADETFCMTVLALELAERVNGVSFLHGRVSRAMWHPLYPERRRNQVPIGHITNGVHLPTFMAPAMRRALSEHLPEAWETEPWERTAWEPALDLPDGTLDGVRAELRRALIADVRERAAREAESRGEVPEIVAAMREALSEDALLIGFARRFATYKRAALVLRDRDMVAELVNDADKPICFVFAGKAHPRDEGGKKLLQRVFEASRDPRLLGKVVLLEDYDLGLGRALTRGVDLWLNNPRRPKEASGTSGQKVVLNGGLNLSILDGWWAEAYDGQNGFAIGRGDVHADAGLQDRLDHEALFDALRDEVLPAWRTPAWWDRVRRSLATLGWRFNSHRMVRDYAEQAYLPAAGDRLQESK